MAYPPLDTQVNGFPAGSDLVQLMCRHIPYIEQYWFEEDADHGHFGSLDVGAFRPPGGPINEMVVRSMGQGMQGYAALYKSEYFDPLVAGDRPACSSGSTESVPSMALRAPSQWRSANRTIGMGGSMGRHRLWWTGLLSRTMYIFRLTRGSVFT